MAQIWSNFSNQIVTAVKSFHGHLIFISFTHFSISLQKHYPKFLWHAKYNIFFQTSYKSSHKWLYNHNKAIYVMIIIIEIMKQLYCMD